MRNSGVILEITEGINKGKFAVARHSKQVPEFVEIKKLFIELYEDRLCQKPVTRDGKKVVGLVRDAFCKVIGYVN